ncbi:hypothetical protein DYB32_007470 [Aphanomyces invadans]|uniref:FYVE-type domain-containing protein n=1 Tax=Aphanomyces invadans TaxID=157072 RepID=A0A418ANX2_9STRA|nr:hypothetical protein DYB32_007470 [Aphanomyces invadans]
MKELIRMNSFADMSIRWKPTKSGNDTNARVALFQGDDLSPTQLTYICAKMEVRGTVSEIADLFYPDDEPLANLRRLFPDLLDAQSIYTLNLPSARAPRHYIGMQWMVFESPSSLIKHRDFCVLECQDEFTDGSQRLGWARSLTSIKTPWCPDLDRSSGIIRGSMFRTGCIFTETDSPGRLDATYFVQMDYKGSVPKAMQVSGMRRHVKGILPLVESFILQGRLRETPFLTEPELVPTTARRSCHVCHLVFGAFHRRRRCRKCGEVVCVGCSSHVAFDELDGLKLRICTACIMHVMLPDEFPNPMRSQSQRFRPEDDLDDIDFHFGVTNGRSSRGGPLSATGQTRRTSQTWDQDSITPMSRGTPMFKSPKNKAKEKLHPDHHTFSVYAPRERLEQPKTPRRSSGEERPRRSSHRHHAPSSGSDEFQHPLTTHRWPGKPRPNDNRDAIASDAAGGHSIPPMVTQADPHRYRNRAIHSSCHDSIVSPPPVPTTPLPEPHDDGQDDEVDLSKYSLHGMIAHQRVQLQRMHEAHNAAVKHRSMEHHLVPSPKVCESAPSDVFSICDTDIMQNYMMNRLQSPDDHIVTRRHGPRQGASELDVPSDPDWVEHIEAAPVTRDGNSPRFIELPPDDPTRLQAPATLSPAPSTNDKPAAGHLDLAAVMQSVQTCLQNDGTFDLNAAASQSLLELYSQLKHLHLDTAAPSPQAP